MKNLGAISLFFHLWLNDRQLTILGNEKVAGICFYADENTFADLPVTRHEKTELKKAFNYLLK